MVNRQILILIVCILGSTGCYHSKLPASVTIRIDLQSFADINSDSVVYTTGNLQQLGEWDARGLPMTPVSTHQWFVEFKVPKGIAIEYKFTRGSWNLEAMMEDCSVPPNAALIAHQDTTISIRIPHWKDECIATGAGITGEVEYHKNFTSQFLALPRDIIVWLPPGYSGEEKYPVLYMQDGQNIIDPLTSYIGQDWKIDEAATRLISGQKMKKIIVVGIYCTELREEEYSPRHLGGEYTKFLIQELKPFIDENYFTMSDQTNTAVMGSSMGGIISFQLAWEHPEVFSMAGCLSPAFLVDDYEILERVKTYTGEKKSVKFYLDNGTLGLETELAPGFHRMGLLLTEKGYSKEDLMIFVDEGATHNEISWSNRVHIPLLFFFGTEPEITP